MNPRANKISLLALLALASATALAAPGANPGSAVPHRIDNSVLQNPEIMDPKDPARECEVKAGNEKPVAQAAVFGIRIGDKCLPQSDALMRAAEASSYLAHYQQHYSNFGEVMRNPETRKEYEQAVRDCINNTNCTDAKKTMLLQALVQYNFGRQLRSNMLENESRARRMASIDQSMSARDWKELNASPTKILESIPGRSSGRPAGSGSLRKNSFRLKPGETIALDFTKVSLIERDKFGVEFKGLVDSYSRSTGKSRWYYVPAKISAVGVNNRYIPAIDPRNEDRVMGKAMVNEKRMLQDAQGQESQRVRDIVSSFQEKYKDVGTMKDVNVVIVDEKGEKTPKTIDAMEAATATLGFGLPQSHLKEIGKPNGPRSPLDVASNVIIQINNDIFQAEKRGLPESAEKAKERIPSSPSSAGPKAETKAKSVMVDVLAFDKFLDDLWPEGVKK